MFYRGAEFVEEKEMGRLSVALLLIGLLLFGTSSAVLAQSEERGVGETPDKDIVETAVAAGNFKTLATALEAAGLIETLKGEGPFTVFAPTDEAFAKLPEGTLEKLLQDKEALIAILRYHVVSGKVTAEDVARLKFAKSILGKKLRIMAEKGVLINNAKVIRTDILTSNGVIHVIDTVLLPPEEESEGMEHENE